MDLQSLKRIPEGYTLAKMALLVCLTSSIVVCLGCLGWTYHTTKNLKNMAYILTEDGKAALISHLGESSLDNYRKPEIIHHIKMFHYNFWNIDQFDYKRKIEEALSLSGDSGKKLYQTLEANGHFAKIVTENLTQKLEIDSIQVNEKVYPFKAMFYGKIRVLRTDQKLESVNRFNAKFILYNVARTNENPHGLLIENYHLEL